MNTDPLTLPERGMTDALAVPTTRDEGLRTQPQVHIDRVETAQRTGSTTSQKARQFSDDS